MAIHHNREKQRRLLRLLRTAGIRATFVVYFYFNCMFLHLSCLGAHVNICPPTPTPGGGLNLAQIELLDESQGEGLGR